VIGKDPGETYGEVHPPSSLTPQPRVAPSS
jgi:hypothetical protein